jgi:hypothetical protein
MDNIKNMDYFLVGVAIGILLIFGFLTIMGLM